MKNVTGKQIAFELSLCGISSGDVVLMHSSLSSIGHVEGGADTVIDAMLDVIGPSGTFAVSTLSNNGEPFDPDNTPSGVGRVSEALRKRHGAIRSLHPIHSIAAIGARATELCGGHDKCVSGCSTDSPYGKLRDMNGKIVLLGVDMNRNTTLHAIEDIMDSCYLEERVLPAPVYLDDFTNRTVTIIKFPPGHRNFLQFTPVLRRAGALIEGRVGRALVKVIDVPAMFSLGIEALESDPLFFMCGNAACEYCANAAAKLCKGE